MNAVTYRQCLPRPKSLLFEVWRWIQMELDRPNSTMMCSQPGMSSVRSHPPTYEGRFADLSSPFGLNRSGSDKSGPPQVSR